MKDIIFKFLFIEIFPLSISSIVYYLFFIGLTLIILNLKYKNKSSSNFLENKKWNSKKIIDFLKIFFIIILIYLAIRFIVLFLLNIFIPVNHRSLYGY